MKDWIKAGLGVGIGYTVGKSIGEFLTLALDKFIIKSGEPLIIKAANAGNESAKEYCEKYDLEYERKDDFERVMGFHM